MLTTKPLSHIYRFVADVCLCTVVDTGAVQTFLEERPNVDEVTPYNVQIPAPGSIPTLSYRAVPSTGDDGLSSRIVMPSSNEFRRHVARTLRAHVRYVDGRRPPASATKHLVDYVVRTAVRERWVMDVTADDCVERIRRLMLGERSELIEMAEMTGFTFVDDATGGTDETLPSSSDLMPSEPTSVDAAAPPQTDATDTSDAAVNAQYSGSRAACVCFLLFVGCGHLAW